MAKRWSVVVVSDAVVFLIGRHLELPVFDWELFLVVSQYS